MTIPQAFQIALQHHQAGRLADAEALYRQILAAQPNHADALHFLGVIAHQVGRHDLAVEWIRKAIAVNPAGLPYYLSLGNALIAQGDSDQAIIVYRRAIQIKPDFSQAHSNLGNALRERGQMDEAIAAYRRAIQIDPYFPEAYNNLGNALREHDKLDEAIAALRRALELKSDLPEFHNNLGVALKDRGQLDEASARFHRALELKPDHAEALINLGIVLRGQRQFEEAVAACRRAVELQPKSAVAYSGLGAALAAQGQFGEAVVAFRRAIELRPDLPEGHNDLGNALWQQGQFDEAIAAFRRALQLEPASPEIHNNLANALKEKGQLDEAIAGYRRAVELKFDYAEAHNNLGSALRERGQLDEAVTAYLRAIQLKPDLPEAHNNLGNAFKHAGDLDEAIAEFRHALKLRPEDAGAHSNLVYTLHFHPDSNAGSITEERQRWNRQFSDPLKRFFLPHPNDRSSERRLRIGYVSPDFRAHVVGRYMLPLFERHDRERFEILCYSGGVRPDSITERFRALSGPWRNIVGVSDSRLADMVREDCVDILVDLTQHMAGNRLPMFARKPAPIQVSFAGYPESTGLDAIEYRISDRYLELDSAEERSVRAVAGLPKAGGRSSGGKPPDCGIASEADSAGFSSPTIERNGENERVSLIDSFWCYDPCGMDVEVNPLPARETGIVTFGCLNNFCKVHERVLYLWARVLGKVKDSRLFIFSPAGNHRQRTLEALEREGVAVSRVDFVEFRPWREYLELYHQLDIVLDTFPYNGGVTTCDALWMGVPVVSLAGKTAVSRAGLSQLTNLGLPELVAHSETEFVTIAEGLAGDLPRLAQLRSTLRDRMKSSVLMDAPRFARQIEQAYRDMWKAWCANQSPSSE